MELNNGIVYYGYGGFYKLDGDDVLALTEYVAKGGDHIENDWIGYYRRAITWDELAPNTDLKDFICKK